MSGRREILTNYREEYGGPVRFGNNEISPIVGTGDIICEKITVKDMSYVQGLSHNLFSIGKFCDNDLNVNFGKHKCAFRTEEGKELLVGNRNANLYTIQLEHVKASSSSVCLISDSVVQQTSLWHRRLSHLNFRYIDQLVKNKLVNGLPSSKFERESLCAGCEKRYDEKGFSSS